MIEKSPSQLVTISFNRLLKRKSAELIFFERTVNCVRTVNAMVHEIKPK